MNKQEIVERLDCILTKVKDDNTAIDIYLLLADIKISIHEETTYVVTIPQEFGYTQSEIVKL